MRCGSCCRVKPTRYSAPCFVEGGTLRNSMWYTDAQGQIGRRNMSANRALTAALLAFACSTAIAVEDATPLLRAIRNNDLVFLKQHLDQSNKDARDDHGATLLMHAAIFGSP